MVINGFILQLNFMTQKNMIYQGGTERWYRSDQFIVGLCSFCEKLCNRSLNKFSKYTESFQSGNALNTNLPVWMFSRWEGNAQTFQIYHLPSGIVLFKLSPTKRKQSVHHLQVEQVSSYSEIAVLRDARLKVSWGHLPTLKGNSTLKCVYWSLRIRLHVWK